MWNVSRIRIIVVIFLAFLLPFLVTFCLHTGKNHYQKLPILGPKNFKDGDTTFHKIRPFELTSHKGKVINYKEDLTNNILLVHFFYTDCPDHCPELIRKLQSLNYKYQDLNDLEIISISLNPDQDNVQKLKDFSKKTDINDHKWHLLTGDEAKIHDIATEDFLISVNEKTTTNGKGQIEHGDQFILVDKERRIRGFYKGTKREDYKKLKDEIVVLSEEER